MTVDQEKLHAFLGKLLADLGGAYSVALVRMGERLGLYRAMKDGEPVSAAELAGRTGLAERYVREWLAHQAASGYVSHDATSGRFTLPPEHAMCFADSDGPVYMLGAFDSAIAMIGNQPMVEAAFRSGGGVAWGDQTGCLFCAVAKFFRPGYQANIVESWLPALDGMVTRLERGARVADIGCGHGHSTMIMAQAFPNSQFVGFDFHAGSIAEAKQHATAHGLPNLTFEVAAAKTFNGGGYDLVTAFDCLHDMGDPVGAAGRVLEQLKPDGSWMIVEPIAGDRLEDNLNPVGRLYYAASTMICVPTSLAQDVGAALGAQAGEAKLREVITAAGFRSVRRATETPFNMVLEAQP